MLSATQGGTGRTSGCCAAWPSPSADTPRTGSEFRRGLLPSHGPAVGGAHDDGERGGRRPYPVHRVWVAVDAQDGRPVPLAASFQRVYGPSARGRQVSARLSHPGPPGSAAARPWPLRTADFDTAGHVNNAVHWAALEDELARWTGCLARPSSNITGRSCPARAGSGDQPGTGELRAWLREGPQPARLCLAYRAGRR